jgi:hypothetical protein
MKRLGLALLAMLVGLVAVTAARVQAAPQKDAPTLSAVSAAFDPEAKATYYTVTFKPPGSATTVAKPTYTWTLQPPPDDPGCKKFGPMPGADGRSVWYHGEEDGCSHLGIEHNGTVSLQVVAKLSNDPRPWVCNVSYFGTLSGTGQEGLCTIEAPALVAVARPPIPMKEKWKIVADLFDECAEAEGVVAAGATVLALPTFGASAAPAAIAGGLAATCVVLARLSKRQAEDPPDANFKVVAPARADDVPQLNPSSTIPDTLSYAFNAFSDNVVATQGYSTAFTTAINRASGAHKAHNATAQLLQQRAAAADAAAIATLDSQRPQLRTALRDTLQSLGATGSLTAAQLATAQQSGLPSAVTSLMAQMGYPSSLISAVSASLKAAKPTDESFPDVIADPSAIQADQGDAAAMLAYVAFARKH